MKKVIEDTFIGKSNNKQIQIKKQTLELIPRKTFLKNEKMKNEYNSQTKKTKWDYFQKYLEKRLM